MDTSDAEWRIIETLLPTGWRERARGLGAFRRARFTSSPSALLRLLLFHAVNEGGLRTTVAQARAAGVACMSAVALLKRLRTSGSWLEWICAEMCRDLREAPRIPDGLRLRVVDCTTIQKPASTTTDWRLHYTMDLRTLDCDWHELTSPVVGEDVRRVPVQGGDVLLGDRNFCSATGIRSVLGRGGQVVVRLRWRHARMVDPAGRPFRALHAVRDLKVGDLGAWPVSLLATRPAEMPVTGRVVAVKLPAPLAHRAQRRVARIASRKGKRLDRRTLQAAHYVMVFTSLPESTLPSAAVLELYRYRWQVELAFKRLKQLLRIGRLPHHDPRAGRSWILAKLVVALLLEKLHRSARFFSPWGFALTSAEGQAHQAQPLELDGRPDRCAPSGVLPDAQSHRRPRRHRLREPQARG